MSLEESMDNLTDAIDELKGIAGQMVKVLEIFAPVKPKEGKPQ